jgi:hypothetical protein
MSHNFSISPASMSRVDNDFSPSSERASSAHEASHPAPSGHNEQMDSGRDAVMAKAVASDFSEGSALPKTADNATQMRASDYSEPRDDKFSDSSAKGMLQVIPQHEWPESFKNSESLPEGKKSTRQNETSGAIGHETTMSAPGTYGTVPAKHNSDFDGDSVL